MEVSMGLRMSMLLSAAMLLPLAAGAQAQKGPPMTTPPASPQSTAPGQMGTAPGQMGTTPGQMQTAPGEAKELTPAVTGQTPSGQTVPNAQAAPEATSQVPVTKGATVYDGDGNIVGKVLSVDSKGAVVTTGTARATIPLSGFSEGARGLTISRTRDQIEATSK
jgi:hypothetical protein